MDDSRRNFLKKAAGASAGAGALGSAGAGDDTDEDAESEETAPTPRGVSNAYDITQPHSTRLVGQLTYHNNVFMPVIAVTNTGSEHIEFTAQVEFYEGDTRAALVSEQVSFSIAPGETQREGLPCERADQINGYGFTTIGDVTRY